MANERVFIAFAIEDGFSKVLFTGQAKNERVSYEFVDMSVKEPWDSAWKTNCRARIKGCDGVIVLVSKNLKSASGALWEIKCSVEEGKKIMGVYVDGGTFLDKPSEMSTITCKEWTWDNVKQFVDSL